MLRKTKQWYRNLKLVMVETNNLSTTEYILKIAEVDNECL